jgi:hypothetical protein
MKGICSHLKQQVFVGERYLGKGVCAAFDLTGRI